jgi:hypothetical protein
MKSIKFQTIILFLFWGIFFSDFAVAESEKRYQLFVNVTPPDSRITIMNIVPKYCQGMHLNPGFYILKISRKGYVTKRTYIRIKNQDVTHTITLSKTGALKYKADKKYKLYVNVEPKDAKIKIGNIENEYKSGLLLKPGDYPLTISQWGYFTKESLVTIKERDVVKNFSLVKKSKYYRLTLNVKPDNATIKLDGRVVKHRKEIILYFGKHELEISCPGYETFRKTIQIKDRNVTELICLEPKLYLLNIKIPATKEESVIKLPSGSHTFEFVKPGYKTKKETFVITNGPVYKEVILTPLPTCNIICIDDNNLNIIINKKYTLRFIRIRRPNKFLDIGLRDKDAQTFYQQAVNLQKGGSVKAPILPLIYYSESKEPTYRIIRDFWIQSETIDSELYKEIIPDGKVDEISYNDAQKFIDTLNKWCGRKAKFDLPNEYQFVHFARKLYNPVKDGKLKTCSQLRQDLPNILMKLFGYRWQLTKSQCRQFDDSNSIKCGDNMYVKKGGDIDSNFATECMPEYRAESLPHARELNTTIRLVFKKVEVK